MLLAVLKSILLLEIKTPPNAEIGSAANAESYNVAIGLAAMTSVVEGGSNHADYNVATGYNALEGGTLSSAVWTPV